MAIVAQNSDIFINNGLNDAKWIIAAQHSAIYMDWVVVSCDLQYTHTHTHSTWTLFHLLRSIFWVSSSSHVYYSPDRHACRIHTPWPLHANEWSRFFTIWYYTMRAFLCMVVKSGFVTKCRLDYICIQGIFYSFESIPAATFAAYAWGRELHKDMSKFSKKKFIAFLPCIGTCAGRQAIYKLGV